jgi:DNA-binding Lrp family transcriptional regulator
MPGLLAPPPPRRRDSSGTLGENTPETPQEFTVEVVLGDEPQDETRTCSEPDEPAASDETEPSRETEANEPEPKLGALGVLGVRSETLVNRRGVEIVLVDSGRKDAGLGRVKKPRGKNPSTIIGPGLRVTQRDLFWLELVARYKYLSYAELAAFASMSETALRNRIPRLVKAGFFDAWRVHGAQTIVTMTKRAASRHGLDYLYPDNGYTPADLTLLHTSAVARTGMMMWWADPSFDKYYSLTEREVRAALRHGGAELLNRDTAHWGDDQPEVDAEQWIVPGPNGYVYSTRADGHQFITGGYRLPDLVLLRRGQKPVAIEVELSTKARDAYRDLFECYLSNAGRERFAGVQYYCGSKHVLNEVKREVRLAGGEDFIRVSEFPDNMPLPIERIQRVTGRKLGGRR